MFYVNWQINVVEFGKRCHFSAFLLHPPPTCWMENWGLNDSNHPGVCNIAQVGKLFSDAHRQSHNRWKYEMLVHDHF